MTSVIKLPGNDYSLVRDGSKKMILRTPDYRLDVNKDDWVTIVFNGLPDRNMLVEIEDVGYTRFGELTLDDAKACGFNNLDELKKFLVERFVTCDNASLLYYYVFRVMGTSEKVGE